MQSVVRCIWHPKLNQIMVGCGDGRAKVFFSPTHSQRLAATCTDETVKERERERERDYTVLVLVRGSKMCVVKKKRLKVEGISGGQQQIIARK